MESDARHRGGALRLDRFLEDDEHLDASPLADLCWVPAPAIMTMSDGYGVASSTRFIGFSAARRTRVNPASVATRARAASPA